MAGSQDPAKLQARVESATPAPLTFRKMFGGMLAYYEGRPLATLYDGGIGVKLSPKDQEEALAAGAEMVRYEPDGPESKSYVCLPWECDDAALADWLGRGIAFVAAQPAKPQRR